MPKPKGFSDFVDAAYQLGDQADALDFYQKWAAEYDHQMLELLGYLSPIKIAQELSRALPNRNAEVLDIGCGTGLTSKLLAEKGYRKLDGIDLSPDMIRLARERGIYRDLFIGDLNQTLAFDDGCYNGVISSGTFTHGHVGSDPLDEIFRILKPGGILACTVHEDLWISLGFKAKFDALIATAKISCVNLQKDSYYKDGPAEGWFCVYRKNTQTVTTK